jgi:menaquinone-dependent protoporphyrinogen IX oxidase
MTLMVQRLSAQLSHINPHGRTLIVVAEHHGYTHAIARALAVRMRKAGQWVDVSDADGGALPSPDGYDAVILGAEARRHRDRRIIGDYVVTHRSALHQMPTGLFLLCDSANALRHIDEFETRVGWRARFAAAFTHGSLGFARGLMRSVLHALLCHLEGSVADRGVKELTALADAMLTDLRKGRRRT